MAELEGNMRDFLPIVNIFEYKIHSVPTFKNLIKNHEFYFDPFNCALRFVILILGILLGIALFKFSKNNAKTKKLAIAQIILSVFVPLLATYVMFYLRTWQGSCQQGMNDFEIMTNPYQGCEFMPASAAVYILLPYLALITTSILSIINLVKIKKSTKSATKSNKQTKTPVKKTK